MASTDDSLLLSAVRGEGREGAGLPQCKVFMVPHSRALESGERVHDGFTTFTSVDPAL